MLKLCTVTVQLIVIPAVIYCGKKGFAVAYARYRRNESYRAANHNTVYNLLR